MPITNCKTGVWILDDTHKKILSGYYTPFSNSSADVGTLWSWGDNYGGILAQPSLGSSSCVSSPMQIPGTTWKSVFGGLCSNFTGNPAIALKSEGTMWAWGKNNSTLGDGTSIDRSSPVQIPGDSWCKITMGSEHAAAIKTDGTLWAWGIGTGGKIGDGTTIGRNSPVQVPGTAWCHVSTGCTHTLAIKTDGTLWGWGCNNNGNLGLGSTTPGAYSSPVQVPGSGWTTAVAGMNHSVGLQGNNLYVWGNNDFGKLGTGTTFICTNPTYVPGTWAEVCTAICHTLARRTDGTLWATGANACGRLGVGDVSDRSSFTQVLGTQWNGISVNGLYSMARKTDGTLWGWGNGGCGQAMGTFVLNTNSPVQMPGLWNDIGTAYCTSFGRKAG